MHDVTGTAVGRVLGTADATPLQFWVAVAPAALFCTVVPPMRRAQRRHRLHRGDPPQRIAGAWREVLDALRLAGRPAPRFLAAQEVAGHAVATLELQPQRTGLPVPTLAGLAGLINVVTFAPQQPDDADARTAAAQAAAYLDELRARQPWWRRLLWSIDPRPLLWTPRLKDPGNI